MTRNKVKFSISIKDLSIQFEGDQQMGQSVQEGIQDSLGQLLSAPGRVLGIEDKTTVIDAAVIPTKRKRRRAAAATAESSNGSTRPKRTGGGTGSLIKELLAKGYFSKTRKVEDVRHELSNKGHNIKAGVISMAMLKLTQQEKLARSKDAKGVFVYKAGSKA